MDPKEILDNLLKSGKDLADKGKDLAADKLGVPEEGDQRDAMLSGLGKGAAVTGVLALLLGTRAGRRISGKAVKYGTLAALGGLAFNAYKNFQAKEGKADEDIGQQISDLTDPEAGRRSMAILNAMIAAAKADGHIDDKERANIDTQIEKLGLESAFADLAKKGIDENIGAKEIAASIDSPSAAAEVYVASLMVIDPDNAPERRYLDELASELGFSQELARELERESYA